MRSRQPGMFTRNGAARSEPLPYIGSMPLPRVLRGFLAASLLFTLLCLGSELVCHFALHLAGPYDFPLLRTYYVLQHKPILFVDFHIFFDKFQFFHSRRFYTESIQLSYPAPAVAAYKLFLIPAAHPGHGTGALARFGAGLLGSSFLLSALWCRALLRRGLDTASALTLVVGTYFLSFGFWFELMQGNIEWMVWVLLSVAVWAFCTSRFRTAAALIGIAGSMKIFPIIYLGLFLSIRRYREAVLTLAAALVSTLIGLWLVCPDIAYSWQQTMLALTSFEHHYVAGVRASEVGFEYSLFALIKLLPFNALATQGPVITPGLYLLTVALGGILLFFLRIRLLPMPNQVLCLAVAAILLPPVSYDYTLLHLYTGVVLLSFVAAHRAKTVKEIGSPSEVPGLRAALFLLAFVLSAQSELIWHGQRYAGQVKALGLLLLGFVSLRYPFDLPGLFVGQSLNSPQAPPAPAP